MSVFEIQCIDCDAWWDVDHDPMACTCYDPAEDAWLLWVDGEWAGNAHVDQ